MNDLQEIWMFTLIALFIVMVPGVDSLLVLKNTMIHGKKAGLFTMIGIILALFVWTALTVLGLATIISKSLLLFQIIKYGGALYLVWLGIQAWRTKAQNMELALQPASATHKNVAYSCMTQGITTDLLNPKTLLLYVTLMPQFIDPTNAVNQQLIVLALILVVLSIAWLTIVVLVIHVIRKWFMKPAIQVLFNKCTGIALIAIGVKIATEKNIAS